VRSYGRAAGEFIAFAGTRGGLEHCDAGTAGAFTATLAGYQAKTVEQKLCALRSFLRFASGEGLAGTATAEAVPAVPSRKQARVPSVWDLCVPRIPSMALTSRVASEPFDLDDHRSCACGSSSS
jgi:hypothetical protein